MSKTYRRKSCDFPLEDPTPKELAKFHGDRPKTYRYLFPLKEQFREFRAKSKAALRNAVINDNLEEFIDANPKESINHLYFD